MGNRRQHTIPRFYLKEFLNSGIVYRRGDKSPRFVKNSKNVAVRIDYYGGPYDDFDFLDKMNSGIENFAAPILKKLVHDATSITFDDWITLSYYFANIHVRTPAFQDSMIIFFKECYQDVSKMAEGMKKAYETAKAEGRNLPVFPRLPPSDSLTYSLDEWNEWMGQIDQKEGRLDTISSFYRLTKVIAEYIQKMAFHILEAPQGLFFVTTDRPLVLYSLVSGSSLGAGWGNKDVLGAIPLSPKHLLVMCHRGKPAVYHKMLSVKDVQFFNIELMKYGVNEIYSKHPYDVALDWMLERGIWKIQR